MRSASRISAILFKEFKQLARDRITFAMIMMIPLVQLLLFGYAINTDVRHVPAALVDHSNSSLARQMVQDLRASQVVDFQQVFMSLEEAEHAITQGDISAVLYIPPDFNRRVNELSLVENPRPVAQWLTDASDPMLSNAIGALQHWPIGIRGVQVSVLPSSTFEIVNYFNPEKRSAVNIVPGLIAVILTMTMILFTSAAIVREREQGNMEFLITTPIRPLELMIGKILPYILVGFFQVGLILGLGRLFFAVPLPADIVSLLIITFLFIVSSLTLGLLISTRAQTQLQAMQMTVFILLPSILLSGFMFPFAAMPKPAQWLAEILPATHYVRMIRGVVLRDAHWTDLTPDVLALLVFSVIGMTAATLRFKKRLD
ncbi:ABC transporter permease [Cellvibrio japonicus]|uniref:Transport permease protein n=1 Tax=Cellvibrio japonicus (strain Ueda107) TaxID=498211 RepID=B3PH19_CELJU|nr:ABC transporter permease [Cellvibrio japonicus]ACE82815.1 ABC-type multidrug transport system, permease component [Cellvibrio japonicus Ueda107]QEI13819.1 ABC transporter permease [Cellvibrio japonicus]QEI17393.1 ABC transporter permease [Cellvibrio japonicus]QEI20969.1 ABC transporter permease [Cellvibrio japonicus]